MKKSKQKSQIVVPRNPLVVQMLNRQGQGRHGKNEKVKRRDGKMMLKKGWDVSSPFSFFGAWFMAKHDCLEGGVSLKLSTVA